MKIPDSNYATVSLTLCAMPWSKHWSWSLSSWLISSELGWSEKFNLSPSTPLPSTEQDVVEKRSKPYRIFLIPFETPELISLQEGSRLPITKLVDRERRSAAESVRRKGKSSDIARRGSRAVDGLMEAVYQSRRMLRGFQC